MTASTNRVAVAAGIVCSVAGALLLAVQRRRRFDFSGAVVLITGGSRGLGLLLAREYGRRGARVVLAARDAIELQRAQADLESRGVAASFLVADVTSPADAARIVDETVARHGRLDVLVNNAGVIQAGPAEHMSVRDYEEAMRTHFWAPLHTMRTAIPHMRRQGAGRIVNISSIGGKIGVPHLVPYCASKFALTGLSTALRSELYRDNILVTTVSPGLMRTGSPINATFKGNHRREFAWFAIADSMPGLSIDADLAARRIVSATERGDAELVVGLPAKLAVVAASLVPEWFATGTALTNALLPSATGRAGDLPRTGRHSRSAWAPSVLTSLSNRAARRNNEEPAF